MIIGVAIRFKGVMVCLPKPNRHHNCISYTIEELGLHPPIGGKFEDQGFYNSEGQYLNRFEAYDYACLIKQEILGAVRVKGEDNKKYLRSENLW